MKQNYEITFEFINGNLFLKIPNNSSQKYNINFFSYSFKDFKNNVFLSRTKQLELVNYGSNLNLFFKEKVFKQALNLIIAAVFCGISGLYRAMCIIIA